MVWSKIVTFDLWDGWVFRCPDILRHFFPLKKFLCLQPCNRWGWRHCFLGVFCLSVQACVRMCIRACVLGHRQFLTIWLLVYTLLFIELFVVAAVTKWHVSMSVLYSHWQVCAERQRHKLSVGTVESDQSEVDWRLPEDTSVSVLMSVKLAGQKTLLLTLNASMY